MRTGSDHLRILALREGSRRRSVEAARRLFAQDPAAGDMFGAAVANEKEFGEAVAFSSSLLVGGPEEDAFLPGAAYAYDTLLFSDGLESGDTSAWSLVVR